MSRQLIMLVTVCASSLQFHIQPDMAILCLVVIFALLTGAVKVISAKFSRCGFPLVVLASRHTFLFDMSMKCWLRIADDCFPASNFASSFSSPQGGELGKLQIDLGKFMARKPIWNRSACHFDCFSIYEHLKLCLCHANVLHIRVCSKRTDVRVWQNLLN